MAAFYFDDDPQYNFSIDEQIEEAITSGVETLTLSGKDVKTLPSNIGELTQLKELILSGLGLEALPKEFSKLTKLTNLDLSENSFKTFPAEITKLTNLTYLDISKNQISTLSPNVKLSNLVNLLLNDPFAGLINLETLNLSGNLFSSISPEIQDLPKLTNLDCSSNIFTSFPPEIQKLPALLSLDLSNNQIKSFPIINPKKPLLLTHLYLAGNQLVNIPFSISVFLNLSTLDLGNNQLTSLPPTIGLLSELSKLDLRENLLTDLPVEISQLSQLSSIHLEGNPFKEFPPVLTEIKSLKIISLSAKDKSETGIFDFDEDNPKSGEIEQIPENIADLVNLEELNLEGQNIISLPPGLQNLHNLTILRLDRNPIPIPLEILRKYNQPRAIFASYFSGRMKSLNECKVLVVGQGSVGKTSIIRRLTEKAYNPTENKTEGIDIYHSLFSSENAVYNVNLWDFGGQEIMHATHQFFLTKRSLYIIVLDTRISQEENRVEYWLKMVEAFGDNSPVIIVGNKSDQHPLDIDRTGLQKKYPNIVGILEASAATGQGINQLRTQITAQINALPHVHDQVPETWFAIKKQLEALGHQQNTILYREYIQTCVESEVTDEISQHTLIGFLHDLGVIIHFQNDPRLEGLGVLNPQWVTNGVYRIINSRELYRTWGVFDLKMLNNILNQPEYPREKRIFIVDMMKKFELCYDVIPNEEFIIPDLLPKDELKLEFQGIPAFEYHYPVLPSSVITRFIVHMNQHIVINALWRSGVLLEIGQNRALVKADFEDRTVRISISGLEHTRRDALSAIRYHLDEIHASIKGLNPEKYVPIPGTHHAKPIRYEFLLKMERAGKETIDVEDGNEIKEINVSQMLNAVDKDYKPSQTGVTVTNIKIGDINIGENAQVGDIVIASKIKESFNKAAASTAQNELKTALQQLAQAVAQMTQALPSEQATEAADDLSKLVDEATKPKPNKKWYSVSIDGLISAAENLGKVGEPVITLAGKVLKLLAENTLR